MPTHDTLQPGHAHQVFHRTASDGDGFGGRVLTPVLLGTLPISQRREPPRNPGRFIAAVALQHGINTNIVHRWIREHSQATLVIQPQAFVPVTLSIEPEPVATKPVAVAATAEIRMELRRGTSSLTVMWPSELAGDCGAWLREWLR